MISVICSELLSALRKVAPATLVRLHASLYVFPARDLRLLEVSTKDAASLVDWHGDLDTSWDITLEWQPLHDYLEETSKNFTVVFLQRETNCLLVQTDSTHGTFEECSHEEPDKETNPGGLPQQ